MKNVIKGWALRIPFKDSKAHPDASSLFAMCCWKINDYLFYPVFCTKRDALSRQTIDKYKDRIVRVEIRVIGKP